MSGIAARSQLALRLSFYLRRKRTSFGVQMQCPLWVKSGHRNWIKSLAEIGWLTAYGGTIVRDRNLVNVHSMPSTADTPVLPDRLMAFTFGFAPPLMIEAAIRHGVFNALDKGAKTIDALCVETGTSPRGLRIVLNALVGLDVLAKDEAGRYALTEESATLLVS